jgi:hypothetical protein
MHRPIKTVVIGGVQLDPRTAAQLRRVVIAERRYRKAQAAAMGYLLKLLEGGDPASDEREPDRAGGAVENDEADPWMEEAERRLAAAAGEPSE